MDGDWKEWDVMELVSIPKVPGFMISSTIPRDGDEPWVPEETPGDRFRKEWDQFVDLLNADGPGTGYERLLALQKNMEARKEEIGAELKKWQDREDRLSKLKGAYYLELQALAEVEDPSPIWKRESVTALLERLPDAAAPFVDQPIVEAFVEFDSNGRLLEWPDLEGNWKLSAGEFLQSPGDDTGAILSTFGKEPKDVDARRENTTVRYRLSTEQLERAGIDPANLDSRLAIQMKPSTTWRDVLLQIEEREQEMREEKKRPKRTLRVLDFRMDVLENVLYQFETYGSVEEMTEGKAGEIVQEELPDIFEEGSKPLEYATEIVQKYRRDPNSLPDGRGAMGRFKESWVPNSPNAEGNSKVSQIFRVMRKEPRLSDEYSDPESLCDLLERLLERHRRN